MASGIREKTFEIKLSIDFHRLVSVILHYTVMWETGDFAPRKGVEFDLESFGAPYKYI
jgi:hypothetical protein